ncbi:MAG TPA: 30S ribosomal protein S7 [candidate division WWE3 bacterium]|uniref:Small ribosomal subunit protein uS7 n=1 Tax=candidate division WWE3 bacterium TaxID=2053526 RepID=A0A7C1HHJ9_UNCKA|nr:30S ribosomal protein S7 [candidate division WWE3 bacterium]
MRGKQSVRREVKLDRVYKSPLVTRFINKVMLHGKKDLAQKIVYSSIGRLAETEKEALEIFEKALHNVMPIKEVRSKRIGGATYQVPLPVKQWRSEALGIRWIVDAARGKSGKSMEEQLFEELKAASEGTGTAVKKREEVHKMADANRAFAHFAN